MSIMDRQALLSNAQAVTVTAVSTNTYDLLQARDLGPGEQDIQLCIRVVTTFTGATSMQFSYITSANADLSSPNTIVSTPAIAEASLLAGTEWLRIEIPTLSLSTHMQRYIGVNYTVVGTHGAGAVTAWLAMDPREAAIYYPSGLNLGGF